MVRPLPFRGRNHRCTHYLVGHVSPKLTGYVLGRHMTLARWPVGINPYGRPTGMTGAQLTAFTDTVVGKSAQTETEHASPPVPNENEPLVPLARYSFAPELLMNSIPIGTPASLVQVPLR